MENYLVCVSGVTDITLHMSEYEEGHRNYRGISLLSIPGKKPCPRYLQTQSVSTDLTKVFDNNEQKDYLDFLFACCPCPRKIVRIIRIVHDDRTDVVHQSYSMCFSFVSTRSAVLQSADGVYMLPV